MGEPEARSVEVRAPPPRTVAPPPERVRTATGARSVAGARGGASAPGSSALGVPRLLGQNSGLVDMDHRVLKTRAKLEA